ncbi:MAG: hypothetical protein RMK01_04075 [Thermomicrobium sp.]|nr:hypothetical protein [Thermomicrobium sp.]
MRVTIPSLPHLLRPGTYPGILTGLEAREADGRTFLVWSFEVRARAGTTTVKATSSASFGPRAKARGWLEALLRRPLQPGETIDTEDLLGLPCLLVVGTRERDGQAWATIEHVLPAADDDE